MSLLFVVILRFEGERLTMLNLSLPYYGTSWADYSEETEPQREESLNAWLSKSLGEQRSFVWGAVRNNNDPHGGGESSIIVDYSAPPVPDW
jgi:outer membrane usher protein FimD/PapC